MVVVVIVEMRHARNRDPSVSLITVALTVVVQQLVELSRVKVEFSSVW